ncbi:glycosyltransferase family 39 protein [Geodermatophilus sp. TF02-6]|uniref:glycosyltransferase family 39 protein n=1 Tax=Geodermatophilus sp. TF02-6 TaxID=2250575 RepID=UPI0013145CDB|nr:glycosyltransferase family 39 protein [Geodermatophilus sp. TF02-6]
MTNVRWRTALALLALVSGAAAVLTNLALFPLYSLNRDDSVYVAMARLMETGAVTLPADADAFRPWASAVVGDRIVLKYTPPWPAVIAAADAVTGSPRAALAVTAAATVVLAALLTAEVLRDRVAGVVAGALLALCPVFVVQSATFLPYVFQLTLGLGFAVLLLSGVRLGSTARLVAAGAVWGVAAFARPFDALLFALPFVLVVLVGRWRARADGGPTVVGVVVGLAGGAVPLLAGSLLYNAVVMGSPLRLPFTVTGAQDTFGFGRRGVFPRYTIDFTPADGVAGLLANLRWTPSWVFGGIVLVALAVLGLARSSGPAQWAVAALAVVVPLGYLPFWGPYAMSAQWEGVQLFGPFYHLPVVVPLVVFGAAGLVGLVRRTAAGARPLAAVVVVVAAMVALTAVSVPDPVTGNRAVTDDFRAVQRFVDDQHLDDAMLLLPRRGDLGFESDTPFLENTPSLRQPVLYAEQRGAADLALAARFPDRALYRLSEDLPPGEDTGGRLTMDRLRVDAGPTVTLRLRLTNPTDRPVAVAYLSDGRRVWSRTLDRASSRGRVYEVTWTLAAPGAASADPDAVRLPDAGVLAAGLDVREADDAGRPGRRWERRVAHRPVDGGARLELLRPGQGWARDDAPGSGWVQAAVGNPVEDLGQAT